MANNQCGKLLLSATLVRSTPRTADHLVVSASEPEWQAPPGFRRLTNVGAAACFLGQVALVGYLASHGWVRFALSALAAIASLVVFGTIAGIAIWYRRATGKGVWALVGPGLIEDFRFGHIRWHRVALVVAAVLFAYSALIASTVGEGGLAASFGAAATILLLVAVLLHRKHRRR